jgi:membrane-associated phospholipid phosphatase
MLITTHAASRPSRAPVGLAALFLGLSLTVLAVGAWAVCPEGQCAPTDVDRISLGLAHSLRSEPLDRLLGGATWLGSLLVLLPLAVLAVGFLHVGGRRHEAGFVMLALLSTSALCHVVKLWVARPRPDLFPAWLPTPEDWSYPSAHTMQATAMALALILVAARRQRAWALGLGIIAVLLVGLSRIYLQVHFPSDVLAGSLAAAFWVGGLYHLMPRPPSGFANDYPKGGRT